MKRGLLFFLSLFLINFVSAQFGYGSFSLTNIFDSINPQDLVLLTLFIIFFAFIFVILSRMSIFGGTYGQPNKAIPGVISFAISLLAVYGIYTSNFDLGGLFSGSLILIILIAGAIFIIWIFGKRKTGFSLSGGIAGIFLILGSLLILTAIGIIFPNIIYEKTTVLFIGIAFFIIGIFLQKRSREWWKKNVESI